MMYQKEPCAYEGMMSTVYGLPLYEQVDVQQMIEDAYNAGKKEIVIPKGAYRLNPKGNSHITLSGMKDFTVSAYDVVFLYQDLRKCGVMIDHCERVTVKGLSSDYEPNGVYQCKIIGIDPDSKYYDVHIDDGYQCDFWDEYIAPPYLPGSFFDGKTHEIINDIRGPQVFGKNVVDLGNGNYRIHMPVTTDQRARIGIGDYICVYSRPYMGGNTSLSWNSYVTLKDYTVWSGCVGVGESYTKKQTHYDNFRVVPGPKPYGATEERICCTVADGSHMQNNYEGSFMENCVYDTCGDDGVNFYGSYCRIAEVLAPNRFVIAERSFVDVQVGERLRFYRPDTEKIGEAVALSITDMPEGYTSPYNLEKAMGAATFRPRKFSEIVLDRELDLIATGWVSNTAHVGNGFILRNNIYRNLRPRGALIKANDGLIENCTFENIGSAGIQIQPELHWCECGNSHNVVVRNNTFINCGHKNQAAMTVSGHKALDQKDIVIEGNRFVECRGVELSIASAQNVTVRDNVFGIDCVNGDHPTALVRTGDFIRFENNVFPKERVEVAAGPTPTNILGAEPTYYTVCADALGSEVQGTDGWRFQYSPVGSDEYFDYDTFVYSEKLQNGWWQGEEENYAHGCIRNWWSGTFMMPGTESDAVKTFVCPYDGEILIDAASFVVGMPTEDGIAVSVRHNREILFEDVKMEHINPLFTPISRTVKKGDCIYFRVNKNGNTEGDGLDWNPTVLYTK